MSAEVCIGNLKCSIEHSNCVSALVSVLMTQSCIPYRFDHSHDIANRFHIMNPHHPHALHDRDGHSAGCAHEPFVDRTVENLPEKCFSRDSHDQRTAKCAYRL